MTTLKSIVAALARRTVLVSMSQRDIIQIDSSTASVLVSASSAHCASTLKAEIVGAE